MKRTKGKDKLIHSDEWENWIGKPVVKFSNRPFKSGKKIGIPQSIEINPNSNKKAFKMDDNSVVDCLQCKLATL